MGYYYKKVVVEKGDGRQGYVAWLVALFFAAALAVSLYYLLKKKEDAVSSAKAMEFSVSAQAMPYEKEFDQNSPVKFSARIKNNTENDASFPLWAEAGGFGQYYSHSTNGPLVRVPAGEEAVAEWYLVIPHPSDSGLLPSSYKVVVGDPYGEVDPGRKVFARRTGGLSWPALT